MADMAIKSSTIELDCLALERAVEQFRSRAVAEFWRLKDRLPSSQPLAPKGADHGPAVPMAAWDRARRQHQLARAGLIPWRDDALPPAGTLSVLRREQWGPAPSEWSAKPRAA